MTLPLQLILVAANLLLLQRLLSLRLPLLLLLQRCGSLPLQLILTTATARATFPGAAAAAAVAAAAAAAANAAAAAGRVLLPLKRSKCCQARRKARAMFLTALLAPLPRWLKPLAVRVTQL